MEIIHQEQKLDTIFGRDKKKTLLSALRGRRYMHPMAEGALYFKYVPNSRRGCVF